jgi:sigma-B regulation protein RsbU (phosphoserine phosphatase)
MILSIDRDGDSLLFRLRDFAPPADPEEVRARALSPSRPGGLGIHFIDTIMDSWGLESPEGGGNLLTMKKCLGTTRDPGQ